MGVCNTKTRSSSISPLQDYTKSQRTIFSIRCMLTKKLKMSNEFDSFQFPDFSTQDRYILLESKTNTRYVYPCHVHTIFYLHDVIQIFVPIRCDENIRTNMYQLSTINNNSLFMNQIITYIESMSSNPEMLDPIGCEEYGHIVDLLSTYIQSFCSAKITYMNQRSEQMCQKLYGKVTLLWLMLIHIIETVNQREIPCHLTTNLNSTTLCIGVDCDIFLFNGFIMDRCPVQIINVSKGSIQIKYAFKFKP